MSKFYFPFVEAGNAIYICIAQENNGWLIKIESILVEKNNKDHDSVADSFSSNP